MALAATAAPAQYPPDPGEPAEIGGAVVHYDTGRPMPRVQVILKKAGDETAQVAASTSKDGRFRFTGLPSAYYTIEARSAGYLPSSFAETSYTRLPFTFGLMPGETLDGIVIRMRPAGVIAGKVEFGDGLPAIGVEVRFYREYFYRGRHGFGPAGAAGTDDRGLYRLFGLPPGRYYVAAAYQPPALGPEANEAPLEDEDRPPGSAESVVFTYYPSTTRMIESLPVDLRVSEELDNMNLTLATAPAARVLVHVTNGETGETMRGASVRLRQPAPAADTMVDAPVSASPRRDGGFLFEGVTPGGYTVVVHATDDGVPMTGKQLLTVAGAGVNDVEVTAMPYHELQGQVMTRQDTGVPLDAFRVLLEPHSDAVRSSSSPVEEDGSFSLPYVPEETYDVFLLDGPPGAYLKSARIGGFDVLQTGFRAQGSLLPPMQLEFSTAGAVVGGEVAQTPTKVALGATVALIPNPARGKMQYYQMTVTDAYGLYRFEGVAPGRYTLISWWDEAPCEVYNLESLEACRGRGESIEVRAGEQKLVPLKLIR